MRSETHPDSPGAFSVAVKTNSGPCFPPPFSIAHPLCVRMKERPAVNGRAVRELLCSAQQTFFLLTLCAICSHHASTHILEQPATPALFIFAHDRKQLIKTENDHATKVRKRLAYVKKKGRKYFFLFSY